APKGSAIESAGFQDMRYWPRCARAKRSGALEISISPLKGVYISRIKKIAPETDNPEIHRAVTTVALRGANSPKLMKIAVSQKTKTTSMGLETEAACCSDNNQRVLPRPMAMLKAWAWSERCASFFGDRAWIWSTRPSAGIDGDAR